MRTKRSNLDKDINLQSTKLLIDKGYSSPEIAKHFKTSNGTVLKRIYNILGNVYFIKVKDNNKNNQRKNGRHNGIKHGYKNNQHLTLIRDLLYSKGMSAMKIRDYLEEQHDIKMSITAVLRVLRTGGNKKDIEQLMLNARQCQVAGVKALVLSKTSKPEQMLRDIILEYYPKAVWKYVIEREDKYFWEVDVALLDQKIAFEYDGLYWHNKKRDILRDQSLQKLGWTVFHFEFYKSPTKEQLEAVVLPVLHNLSYLVAGQKLKNAQSALKSNQ